MVRRGWSVVLTAWLMSSTPWAVEAQQACDVDEAQRLFGEQPKPLPRLRELLAACERAGSRDYRVYMFLGVISRDAGDRTEAIAQLRRAYELAPTEPNPALELAFTLEPKHASQAAQVYRALLARDPDDRAALLGLARVDRSQQRLEDARLIYERMLKKDPWDADALNGLAWLQLANRNREKARSEFETVLAKDPNNDEAKYALTKVNDVYKYVFDTSGAYVSTTNGNSWGFGASALIGLDAFNTIEIGEYHFTNELVTVSSIGLAVLPSNDVRLGFYHAVPTFYNLSLTYDYRTHATLPSEHWIEGGVGFYVTDRIKWFGTYRQAFGATQWNGRLIRTGLGLILSDSWEVGPSVFSSAQGIFNNYQNIFSWVFDVTYRGPENLLVVFGVGYSPMINNVDLHARAIVPMTERFGVTGSIAYNSINADTRATAGLRINW
jgi:tetratricopeptide (TPR) repeat protein